MNSVIRKELNNRLKEVRAELAAISETKVIPAVDLPDREDRLLDELDALEFELAINHLHSTPYRLQQNTIGRYLMSSNITHRCQLCGREITSNSKSLPTGWIRISIVKSQDDSGNAAILCELCSTKRDAAEWVLGSQRQGPTQIMNKQIITYLPGEHLQIS